MKTGLILEDLKDAQKWLFQVLESSFPGINIETAETIEEAEEILTTLKPDIALIDLNLPDGSGVSILQLIANKYQDCISVVTTIYDDDDALFSALCAGAQGYLLKEQKKDKLIAALKGISEGAPALSPQISTRILDYFSSSPREMKPLTTGDEKVIEQLTQREKEVLKILTKGSSTKKAAEELNISYHTVASHIKSIYSKLGISTRAEAVKEALRLGMLDN